MTKSEIDQLCDLLSKLRREQWLNILAVVDSAYSSSRKEFIDCHKDEWEKHGKTPEWFSERLAVLLDD